MSFAIPYIILILVFGGMAYIHHVADDDMLRQRMVIASVVLFVFFFGFRGFILSDWIIYYPYFYEAEWRDVMSLDIVKGEGFEPGFVVLTMLCKTLFEDYHFYVFVLTIINTVLLMNFFRRYSDNIPLSLMLYVVFEGLVISTNLMRNSIAIFLFLNALPYLIQRRPQPYFGLCLLACTFHLSSFMYLPLYFFFHYRLNKWAFLGIFVVANIAFLMHVSFLVTFLNLMGVDESTAMKVKAYTDFYDTHTGISIGYLERLMTGLLVFLYYDKLKEIRQDNAVFINGLLAYLTIFFVLSEFQVVSKRICTLFAFGYWIIWADMLKCFYYQNNRRLYAAFLGLYCVFRIAGSCYLPDFEYDNLLMGRIKSYNERLYIHNKTFEPQ